MIRTTYIYELVDPRDNKPFYVGKTINLKRRLYSHIHESKTKISNKDKFISNMIKDGFKPIINVIDETNDDNWSHLEIKHIMAYSSKFNIFNKTKGGGCSNNFIKGRVVSTYNDLGDIVNSYKSIPNCAYDLGVDCSSVFYALNNGGECRTGLVNKYRVRYGCYKKIEKSKRVHKDYTVSLYNLFGKKLKTFKNKKELGDYVYVKKATIQTAVKYYENGLGGVIKGEYIACMGIEDEIKPIKTDYILLYDKCGTFMDKFSSVSDFLSKFCITKTTTNRYIRSGKIYKPLGIYITRNKMFYGETPPKILTIKNNLINL